MHANTRGRQQTVARTRRAGSDRSPARRGGHGRRPGFAAVALATAVALAGSACSTASETDLADASPTFARANGSGLAFSEPLADVSDLVGPATEDGEWTIVGSVFDPESKASEATVWTSDDARGWERTTVDPARSGKGESMTSALATDGGMIAVGQVGEGAEADAAVWHRDGDDWRQLRPDVMGGDHEQWAFKVVSGEGGMLVAGGESVWGEIRPRLWFSADGGESWKTVDGGAGGPFDETGEESVRDITAVGSGFVAVGSRTVDTEQDGLAWYSPDGETWEALDVPTMSGPGRQDVRTVTATEGAVVAGGFSDDANGQGKPTIWRAADGRAWEGAIGPLPMTDNRNAARDLAVRSITVGDRGLIAAGGSDWRPRVWYSTNAGASWEELPNPVHGELFQDGVSLVDAVGAQGITVALGSDPAVLLLARTRWEDATGDEFPRGGEQPFATSVAAGPEGAIAAGGRYTAATGDQREVYTGQIWQRDGDGWKPVETEHLAAGHIMDAVPFAGGFAAVGFEDFGVADGRVVGDQEPDGIVWVSNNGKDWARIGAQNAQVNTAWLEYLDNPTPELAGTIAAMEAASPPVSADPAGGDGTRSLAAVAPLGSGFIAVGSVFDAGDANPIIINSADGTSFVGEEPVHSGAGIQQYNDVCVAPDGRVVAVGNSGAVSAFDAIVATRVEGEGWFMGDGPFTGDGDQQAYACAASDEGFVMVGADDRSGGTDARVWTSEDGIDWTLVESSLLGGDGDQWASAVAPVPDGGWIVAGTDTAGGDGDIALWRITADGEIFRRDRGEPALGGPGEQTVTNITVDEDGHVLLAGNDYGRVGLWESDSVDR